MPETRTYEVFTYEELSDSAKERARQWWTSSYDDNDYAEYVYDDAATVADILGLDIRQTRKTLMNGQHRYDPTIYYSGFWSQGDGACYEGSYRYAKQAPKRIREYAPLDTDLHQMADRLQALQRRYFYKLEATTKHSGHYYHEYCMNVSVSISDDPYRGVLASDDEELTDILRDFARWIYKRLEAEYDYQTSDEVVEESLIANDYLFTVDGVID